MPEHGHLGPGFLHYLFVLVNKLCEPVTFYTLTTILFFAALRFRKFLVKPAVAATIGGAGVLFLGVSLFNYQFYKEATKPDNAPIWIMLVISSICMWAAFWQAVNNDERTRRGEDPDEKVVAQEKLHVWPYLVYLEGVIAAFVMVALFVWSLGLDAPLEMYANPAKSPNPAKAPWYFLGLQELLVYYDPWIAGVVLPGMIIVGLIALPYCDPNPKGVGFYTFEQRKFAITTYLFGYIMMWLVLIFVGTFLRGQNWNFFGLYETWDAHKVIAANNINVSDVFWQNMLHKAPNSLHWFKREIPGFIILGLYFTVVPLIVTKVFKNFYQSFITTYQPDPKKRETLVGRMPGLIRYSIIIMLLLVMIAVPIKMYLRWAFDLKYIVFIPEYFFNI